jgi:hypothetical protein
MARRSRSATSRHRRQRGSLVVGAFALILGVSLAVALGLVVHNVGGADAGKTASGPLVRRPTTGGSELETGQTTAANPHWFAVLEALDRRRATAWRLGRPELLNRVYTSGCACLQEDRDLLDDYLQRGLRVSGVDLRFAAVSVRRRTPGSVSLLVEDRLGRAVALDRAGHRERLPRDLPTRHRIRLRLVGRDWRIERVAVVRK